MQISKCKLTDADAGDEPFKSTNSLRSSMTPQDLSDRILDFADRIATVVEALPDTRLGRRISDQLLRSGTSPLGNYEEACAAESKDDFAHKLRICLKEVRESRGWLRLVSRRNLLPAVRLEHIIDEAEQLARILGQSIATAKGVPKKTK